MSWKQKPPKKTTQEWIDYLENERDRIIRIERINRERFLILDRQDTILTQRRLNRIQQDLDRLYDIRDSE